MNPQFTYPGGLFLCLLIPHLFWFLSLKTCSAEGEKICFVCMNSGRRNLKHLVFSAACCQP